MHSINHKVRIIAHLRAGHYDWIVGKDIVPSIKTEKEAIKGALKPNKYPGGSKEDNVGVAYDFPDPQVKKLSSHDMIRGVYSYPFIFTLSY